METDMKTDTIKLGLTGAVAMGKSTVAAHLSALSLPVHDADAAVHALLAKDADIIAAVLAQFPAAAATKNKGAIDRKLLGAEIFGDTKKRRALEAIIHPRLRQQRTDWTEKMARANHPVIVYDIPLLFETNADNECDYVAVVATSPYLQKKRALARAHMDEARFNQIIAAQMPNAEKCQRADYIIPTSFGISAMQWYIAQMLNDITLRGTNPKGNPQKGTTHA